MAERRIRSFGVFNPLRDADPFLVSHFSDDFERGVSPGALIADPSEIWEIRKSGTGAAVVLGERSNGWWRLSVGPGAGEVVLITRVPVGRTSSDPFTHFRIIGAFVPGQGPEEIPPGSGIAASFIQAGITSNPAAVALDAGIKYLSPIPFGGAAGFDIALAPLGSIADTTIEGISEDCADPNHLGGIISNSNAPPGVAPDGPGPGVLFRSPVAFDINNVRGELFGSPTDIDPQPVPTMYPFWAFIRLKTNPVIGDPGYLGGPNYTDVAASTRRTAFDLDFVEVISERGCVEPPE